jgi:hypothetical protein
VTHTGRRHVAGGGECPFIGIVHLSRCNRAGEIRRATGDQNHAIGQERGRVIGAWRRHAPGCGKRTSEGATDGLVIELPKGGYKPTFRNIEKATSRGPWSAGPPRRGWM